MTSKILNTGMAGVAALCLLGGSARGEAILQVFNQSHNEIAARLPEIAEAGYTALWVPPPTKANGGMSVGYDLNDPFDLGNSDLRGTWSTRYGVEADLHNLIEFCHRFGMRVYFDNVMNHRSYDVPGYNENTPTDVYPGMCPEDFHLRTTSDGFYRKWDNVRSWDDEWQVMYLGLSDLLDIAHETPNGNFGATEGSTHEKPKFLRHPNNPEYYDRMPDGSWVGFGTNNGITTDILAQNAGYYSEDVGGYLCRAVRWLVDRTKVDGLRLDAVKHVPYYFFGKTGDGADSSDDGYVGQVQWQFNMSRGFKDWANHRDTVFDSDAPRNDAMLFGEHLGSPPPQGPYVAAGMRLVDDRLRNELNWRFGANQLSGFDQDGAGSDLGSACGVMHAQSHDNDYVDRKPLHHAFYFMHKGLALVYSDGNNHAATLTGSGGAFPRWARTDFLGQWGQKQIPTLLHAHENFARYDQIPKWSADNFIAWQRGGTGDYATMLFQLNSSWDGWDWAHTRGDFGDGAYLYDYASDMYMPHNDNGTWAECPFVWGGELSSTVKLPPNSYAIWNWKNPDPSSLYPTPYPDCFVNTGDVNLIAPDSRVITIFEDGQLVEPVMVTRKDGVDGDVDFNPYGVADTNHTDYSYSIAIPRVTKGTNVTLEVKGDGSAGDLLLRLDGGMDFGNHAILDPETGAYYWGMYKEYNDSYNPDSYEERWDWRDYPPGSAHDFYLGFEKGKPYFKQRIWSEKFAAPNISNCWIGTGGACTYQQTQGGAVAATEFTNLCTAHSYNAPGFVWHSPTAETDPLPAAGTASRTTAAAESAKSRALPRASATWIGATYIFANDWYKGDAQGHDNWYPAAFHGANLGEISGSISFGGQCQTYGEPDGEGNPARACYNVLSGGSVVKTGHSTLYWYKYEDNNNWFESQTGNSGTWQTVDIDVSDLADGAYTLSVWFEADGSNGSTKYDNNGNANYEASFTIGSGGSGGGGGGETHGEPQFAFNGTGATIWAQTSQDQGVRAYVYYTVDGAHWPEGAGGLPANPATKAIEGHWQFNAGQKSWWRFEIPQGSIPAGATLRYKISAFREQNYGGNGWDVIWPGDADAIKNKRAMMTRWSVTNLDLTTQQYHLHNDYATDTWVTGFKDGYHLVTARLLLNRENGAPVANTFRQTFYLDTHVPDGYFLYPDNATPEFRESEYGLVLKTDNTVDEVWYHIEDSDDGNDGIGNGKYTTNGVSTVEWAKATQISPWTKEMAQDTEFTKIWRFTYSRIPSSGTATIRVRLREVSSVPADEWNKDAPETGAALEALHVKEMQLRPATLGPTTQYYFVWPDQDGTMVQEGWTVRLRFSTSMLGWESDHSKILDMFQVCVNTTNNGSYEKGAVVPKAQMNMWLEGNTWDSEMTLAFDMPNVNNGIDGWRYALTVDFANSFEKDGETLNYNKTATRIITHAGALLPTCIITTPPETDSDGAKWVITMEDSTVSATNKLLRETPIVVLADALATNLSLQFVAPEGYAEGLAVSAEKAADCAAEEAAKAEEAARTGVMPTNQVAWPEAGALRMTGFSSNGTTTVWSYAWEVTNAGTYRFQADVKVNNASRKFTRAENSALRSATVQRRQLTRAASTNDADWDDDGIVNTNESSRIDLPERGYETWTQKEVFDYWSSGRSDPDCPDTDGDGLPDALELGARVPGGSGTDASADTNGDGWPNFIWDRDPPFYDLCGGYDENAAPNCGNYGAVKGVHDNNTTSRDISQRIAQGTVTDPRNADSDYDGIPDGIEDANRNGWTDGDGVPIGQDWNPWLDRAWPDGVIGTNEVWEETSPCVADSDGDGLSDGYGEDRNANGWTDIGLRASAASTNVTWLTPEDYMKAEYGAFGVDAASTSNSASTLGTKPYTSRAIDYKKLFAAYNVTNPNGHGSKQDADGWPRLVFAETDPLNDDTDGDGLFDGWEVRYGLDPLNNGIYDFRTGEWTVDNQHGASGNPDGDTYVVGGEEVPYTNLDEQGEGSNPRSYDSGGGSGETKGSITVGSGDAIGEVNQKNYYTEFTQWTLDDLIALDDYNNDSNTSDIYRWWNDGEYDSSRDMVAFYFRDGGEADGKLYFRVDFDDLKAYAENGHLDVYVAINYGFYGRGLEDLPNNVDCKTTMGWNAFVGVFDSQNGCLYVQNDEGGYDSVPGFHGAYFNSELDSVMWSIDRAALTGAASEAGRWTGSNPDRLMFQVFTTRDGTGDGDAGHKSGINDFTDIIGGGWNDWICSDYWNDWNNIANNGKFEWCASKDLDDPNETGKKAFNHCGQHAKLALVAHGNQAVEAGSTMQALVNNGQGAGYGRPVKIHNIYTNCPLNLHITPTLAVAMEWAEAGTTNTWYSGREFNDSIRSGVARGGLALMGSTYSDHMLKYFGDDFNAADEALARKTLNDVYGEAGKDVVSSNVLWSSERVCDWKTLQAIANLGFQATVVDQTPHLQEWFGRQTALGDNAYKIQRYWAYENDPASGTSNKAFVLSTAADQFRFANTDSGLVTDLRRLFLRRARSGQAAISSIFYRWEDFADGGNADGYDANLRWIANHPWIQVVTFDQALADEALNADQNMYWTNVWAEKGMAMQDWVHHACNGNYDNWYYGSWRHKGLAWKTNEVRAGVLLPSGMFYGTPSTGLLAATWNGVKGITNADVRALAEATLFASVFETAFHNEVNDDLSRWSYGDYRYPAQDTGMDLLGMSWCAESRTRLAAVFTNVDAWAARKLTSVEAFSADVDLDGEPEWILRNDKVMALFEAEGGLMVGAWLKDGNRVWQMVGNFAAQPETGYETHGVDPTNAFRGAAMKDKWIGNTSMTTNNFTVTKGTGKLTFKSGSLTKTVSLANADANAFAIAYSDSGTQMYVRNGLSPDLSTLLVRGQGAVSEETTANSVAVTTSSGTQSVTAVLNVTTGSVNTAASDKLADWNTVNMRNAAQVRDVEVMGTGSLAYTLEFSTEEREPEYVIAASGVKVPMTWLQHYYPDYPAGTDWTNVVNGAASNTNNQYTVWMCYVADLNPTDVDASFEIDAMNPGGAQSVTFPVVVPPGRVARVKYADSPTNEWTTDSSWSRSTPWAETGSVTYWYSNQPPTASRFYRAVLQMLEE